MFQTDQATAASSLPAPSIAGTQGFFTNGNPATGVAATILDADFLNMMMMELINVVEAGGLTPSKTTYTQIRDAVLALVNGSQNAYTGFVSHSTPTTLTASDIGPLIGATATTLTMMALSTVTNGQSVSIISTAGAGGVTTINTSGTDKIQMGSVSLSTITVPSGQAVRLTRISSTTWLAEGLAVGANIPLVIAAATAPNHAVQLGQASQIFGGAVTTIPTAGTTTLTAANAGLILVNASGGNVTINLPAASAQAGSPFQFVRIDSGPANTVTVNRAGSDTIDGSALTSFQLVGQFDRRHIKSNGVSAWYTISTTFASQASAYQSTSQTSIPGGTFTKVNLQTKLSDGGGEFDATTNFRFTAKQAGLYQVNGGINVSSPAAGNGYFCSIFQNGSMVSRGSSILGYAGSVQSCASVSALLNLAAGDFVELYAFGDNSFSLVNGPSATRLSIARVQ
jgi:hypothetical protein